MNVTTKGSDLIKEWQNAQRSISKAHSQLLIEEKRLDNAVKNLGDWISPGDMKVHEKICVWYGDALIQVELIDVVPDNKYKISIRKHGTKACL